MIIFLDTEFSGLHQQTTLMSIALLAYCPTNPKINGRAFYAEMTDYAHHQVNPWIRENVVDNFMLGYLTPAHSLDPHGYEAEIKASEFPEFGQIYSEFGCGTREGVKKALSDWLDQFSDEAGDDGITIVADVLAYDWVLFNDLMANYDEGYPRLPSVINYIPIDFSSLLAANGIDPDVNRHHFCGPAQLNAPDWLLLPSPLDGAKHNALADVVQLYQGFNRLAAQRSNSRALPHGDVYRFGLHNLDDAAREVQRCGHAEAIWILSMDELHLMNNVVDMGIQFTATAKFHQDSNGNPVERVNSVIENRPLDSHLLYRGVRFWLMVVPDLRDHDTRPRVTMANSTRHVKLPTYGHALSLVHEFMDAPVRLPSMFGQLYTNGRIQVVKMEENDSNASQNV